MDVRKFVDFSWPCYLSTTFNNQSQVYDFLIYAKFLKILFILKFIKTFSINNKFVYSSQHSLSIIN